MHCLYPFLLGFRFFKTERIHDSSLRNQICLTTAPEHAALCGHSLTMNTPITVPAASTIPMKEVSQYPLFYIRILLVTKVWAYMTPFWNKASSALQQSELGFKKCYAESFSHKAVDHSV